MSINSKPVASERIKAKMSLLFIDDLRALRGAERALHCRRCAIDTTRYGKIQRLRGVQIFIGHIHFLHEPLTDGGASTAIDGRPESPLGRTTTQTGRSNGCTDRIISPAHRATSRNGAIGDDAADRPRTGYPKRLSARGRLADSRSRIPTRRWRLLLTVAVLPFLVHPRL